jgi:hypothetical protein
MWGQPPRLSLERSSSPRWKPPLQAGAENRSFSFHRIGERSGRAALQGCVKRQKGWGL